MYIGIHAKYPLFLSDFNETWISSTDVLKILNYLTSRKSIQWEPRGFTDGYDEANSNFRNFSAAPKIQHFSNKYYLRVLTGCDFQNKQLFFPPMHRKSVGFCFASRECLLYGKHWIFICLFREIRDWSAIVGHGLSLHGPRVWYRASPCAIYGGQGDTVKGTLLLRVPQFFPISITPQTLLTYLHLNTFLTWKTSERNLGIIQQK